MVRSTEFRLISIKTSSAAEIRRMELAEAKDQVKAIENALADVPFVEFHVFEREGRRIRKTRS